MKILHTSDLHLGKKLLEEPFYEDQEYILNEIIKIISQNKIDVFLIAGDIFDKNIPSVEAIKLFNDFLNKLVKLNIKVLIISGNHDSNERLDYGSEIFKHLNIHIVSNFNGRIEKITIDDVDFYLLPYIKPFHLKSFVKEEEYEKIKTSNDLIKYLLDKIKLDENKSNILMLHQFVTYNGFVSTTDSERSILGTLDEIDVNLLENFDYVALGHVHRPQKIKHDFIRYSGTPLAYSFSEVNDKKSLSLYDTNTKDIKLIPLVPKRQLKIITGYFEDVLKMSPCNDIIKVELLDENNILSPMEEIKKRFPNAISLTFKKQENNDIKEILDLKSPEELFNKFYFEQHNRNLNSNEINYIKSVMEE